MSTLVCPKCGSDEWAAEEISTNYPIVKLSRDNGEVEIEMDPMAELGRFASDSFIRSYLCKQCPYVIEASDIYLLKEASDEA